MGTQKKKICPVCDTEYRPEYENQECCTQGCQKVMNRRRNCYRVARTTRKAAPCN